MGEPGRPHLELRCDSYRPPCAQALLFVHVVETLALAVVGAELESDEAQVIDLVLIAEARSHIVGKKAGRAEQIVGGPRQKSLPSTALDRGQVGRRCQLVAAERALLLSPSEIQGPLACLRGEADVDIGVSEPDTA